MAAQPWHVSLPQVVDRDGFQKDYGDTVIRSQTDIGPGKVRRRSTRPRHMYNIVMTISGAQEQILDQFFNTNLNGGASLFYFTNPITNVVMEYRFNGTPKVSPVGYDTFKAQFSWEEMGEYLG